MEKIILIYLLLQPMIDVLTAVSMFQFHHSFVLGLGIRFFFLLLMIYYAMFYNKKIRKYLMVMISYCFLFLFLILYFKGKEAFFFEWKSLVKTFYFPFVFVAFYEIFYHQKKEFNTKYLKILYLIYLSFVLFPNLFHFGFRSYEVTKGGSIGFFYTANEIGAILAILMPIFFSAWYRKKNLIFFFLGIIVTFYVYFSIGTKAPLLLFLLLLGIYFLSYCKKLFISKKYKNMILILGILVICFCSLLFLLPKTNFYKNIKVHLEFLEIEKPSDLFKDTKTLDHFIFSERLSFWANTNHYYQKSNFLEKIFGIGYINGYSTDQVSMKLVEMDFVDLFYRHGIVGFLLYLLPFIVIFVRMIKQIKLRKLTSLSKSYTLSILFSFLLTLITGHVILSPSVSIYVALIFILLYNDIYKESKYDKEKVRYGNT